MLFREDSDNRGALPQQSFGAAVGSGVRSTAAALHRDHLLLLHAQVARATQTLIVNYPHPNIERHVSIVSSSDRRNL